MFTFNKGGQGLDYALAAPAAGFADMAWICTCPGHQNAEFISAQNMAAIKLSKIWSARFILHRTTVQLPAHETIYPSRYAAWIRFHQ